MENNEIKGYVKNGYKQIEVLTDKENGPVMVRNNETQKFWVRKEYPVFLADSLATLQKIEHRNLPKIEEIVVDGDRIFLYEEYIHGKTLSELIQSSDSMDGQAILELALSVLDSVEKLHGFGLIHRDIKPSNIMLTNDQVVKVIDFDAVRRINGNKENDTVQLGTVGFAAPEQFGFAESDARSDLYSLGVVMNICSTKDYPKNHLSEDLLIREIIIKATRIDPEDRYQTANEMREAIIYQLDQLEQSSESVDSSVSENEGFQDWVEVEEVQQPVEKKQRKNVFSISGVIGGISFLMKYIPGFRTKQLWKMFVAVTGYVFIGMLINNEATAGNSYEYRGRWIVDSFFLFIVPILLYANFLDFHRNIPFLASTSVIKKILGYVFLTMAWFILLLFYTLFLRDLLG
ncbi:serine/threonine protein kinase [Enterococcus sp. BWM-S5]|uniref:non-specific serine/threonine protein kinase n=1 Tax=Enterococcus larvae TaxID=2794352 RepID=A0ABS4CG27_9ENTE|nr:serine/threonine-protein kinase [Enterococcus larvae]MBP1044902.1 serine/threonine protein kinase [Enterococcus larvae]